MYQKVLYWSHLHETFVRIIRYIYRHPPICAPLYPISSTKTGNIFILLLICVIECDNILIENKYH